MEVCSFIKQYYYNPMTVGALVPSSKNLADKMIEDINFSNAECILEYGPGTGIFTEKILQKKKNNTVLLTIEYNDAFYNILKNKFEDHQNFFIVKDSAANIIEHLDRHNIKKVDYVISGIPFASLDDNISCDILSSTKEILGNEGVFITFQYTLFKMKLFSQFFKDIEKSKVLFNFPPAYVLKCKV
ncbi:ribosomal RNA adenine dimethylase [Alkaliphilus metalliredigens QYMF]|uniref:Ribosomal RNA adenine dimethylase n=1 Tax=Alkaliphilus metalliredigens (strain QYMF) TaxID=293826 RepID=A6TP37_ALKMQ|nr:rRNA adenine N-6-methyltransferase family protein [Alkaliphilus metalliredigens]ABR47955.1 ribosomal RNA adenine dimethylase [Alkaliphilus metalliredigens QYMF]